MDSTKQEEYLISNEQQESSESNETNNSIEPNEEKEPSDSNNVEDNQDTLESNVNNEEDKESSESNIDSDSDSDYDFIDSMLEKDVDGNTINLPCKRTVDGDPIDKTPQHEERNRIVLIKRGQNHFEILPEGWVEITHFSGMPVYLHKQSRVCTLSKPYYLGQGSARKHEIPCSAIPCLQYKRELEKEKEEEEKDKNDETKVEPDEIIARIAKVETMKSNKKEKSLDYNTLREYCMNLFEFKTVTIRKFKTWADRRKHAQIKKISQRPSLPESTKLITCSVPKNPSANPLGKASKKEFIMNPAGKSVVCILHEFVQHTGRTQPKYIFQELENVSKPYSATVVINGMEYGRGYGSSKKEAKTEAARASLDILIPDLKNAAEEEPNRKDSDLNDLSFFDNIRIEDPRVSELCLKAGQYSPYQILVECLRRHHGIKDFDIDTGVKLLKHQKNEYKMKVGDHEAIVICKNKREGKQRAAQAILKQLHPHLNSWGALLKLYGRGSCKTPKEKKEEALQITELQNTASSHRPNYAILNKLREEMLKLKNCPMNIHLAPINSIHIEPNDTIETST